MQTMLSPIQWGNMTLALDHQAFDFWTDHLYSPFSQGEDEQADWMKEESPRSESEESVRQY